MRVLRTWRRLVVRRVRRRWLLLLSPWGGMWGGSIAATIPSAARTAAITAAITATITLRRGEGHLQRLQLMREGTHLVHRDVSLLRDTLDAGHRRRRPLVHLLLR